MNKARVKITIGRIQEKISQYIEESGLTDYEIYDATGIEKRVVESLRNKQRVCRLFYWHKLKTIIDGDPKRVARNIHVYNKYLKKEFNEYFKNNKALIHYLTRGTTYPYYSYDKEDIFQKIYQLFWERMDDLDTKSGFQVGTFLGVMVRSVKSVIRSGYGLHAKGKESKSHNRIRPHDFVSIDFECDTLSNGCEGLHILDSLTDGDPRNESEYVINKLFVEGALDELKEREKFIIEERCLNGRTLEDVGTMLSLTRERVRQIEEVAWKKIANNINKH